MLNNRELMELYSKLDDAVSICGYVEKEMLSDWYMYA